MSKNRVWNLWRNQLNTQYKLKISYVLQHFSLFERNTTFHLFHLQIQGCVNFELSGSSIDFLSAYKTGW